jgi:hypothetical protein
MTHPTKKMAYIPDIVFCLFVSKSILRTACSYSLQKKPSKGYTNSIKKVLKRGQRKNRQEQIREKKNMESKLRRLNQMFPESTRGKGKENINFFSRMICRLIKFVIIFCPYC